MRHDLNIDCISQNEVVSNTTSSASIRTVGMIPSFDGVFCLPDFHPEILSEYSDDQTDSQTALSIWSLHAHNNGMQLPNYEFVDLNSSISCQLDDYIKLSTDSDDFLPFELLIVANSDFVDIDIIAQRNIPLIKLKEWTNHLNNVCEGLGWWAYSVINSASNHYPTYSLSNIPDLIQTFQYIWEPSNDLLVAELNLQGEYPDGGDEDYYRDNFLHFWPSDVSDSIEGHGWMVDVQGTVNKPKAVEKNQVLEIIEHTNDAQLKMFLTSCIELNALLDQNKELFLDNFQTFGKTQDIDIDRDLQIGAACLITWDDPSLHLEIVSHFEQTAMECSGTESLRIWRIDHMDTNAMDSGLTSIKLFIQLHALFGRVLNFYTVEKN